MSLPNANFSRYKNRDVVWGRTLTSRCTSFTSGNNIAQRGHRQHLSYFQQQQQQQQNGPYVTVRYVNLPAQLFGCLQAEHLDPREHSSYATNATTGLKKKTSQLASGSTRQDVCPWRPRFRALARSSRPAWRKTQRRVLNQSDNCVTAASAGPSAANWSPKRGPAAPLAVISPSWTAILACATV